jgi:hypothetical protein
MTMQVGRIVTVTSERYLERILVEFFERTGWHVGSKDGFAEKTVCYHSGSVHVNLPALARHLAEELNR